MGEEQKNLRDKRMRRKRINRIKTSILLFIFGVNLLCIILCIVLFVRVHSIQRQLDILTENILNAINEGTEEDARSSAGEIFDPSARAAAEDDEPDIELQISDVLLTKVRAHLAPEDNVYQEGDTHKVYLTFDDGPSANTERILDILDEHGVKATFFVNGKDTEELRPLYKEITDRGNTIGMHSYTHNYIQVYESVESFAQDYQRIYDLITELTGVEPQFYRFPGGSSNHVSSTDMDELIRFLGARGIVYYDWNVVSGDATTRAYTANDLVENVMGDVVRYKTSVVLMHDASNKSETVEALSVILDRLEEMGCEILPITQESDVIHHI